MPDVGKLLKAGITLESLDRIEKRMSDTEYARRMSKAKCELLRTCKGIEGELPKW